jgi:hypothetical protein
MLVYDLSAVTSDKLNREVVKPFDLALKSDPVHKEHRYLYPVVSNMRQEYVLES